MEVTEKIKHLNKEQLATIVKARRAQPIATFASTNAKARGACSLRHQGWMDEQNKYTNAAIEAFVRTNDPDALKLATLMSAFEAVAVAVIAKHDLTLEEYDTLIKPIIEVFPELIVVEQDWTPVPIETETQRRYIQYQAPPSTGVEKEKKGRPFRRVEDLESVVNEVAFENEDIMAALKPKAKPAKEISKDDAIQAMLNALKPKEPVQVSDVPTPKIEVESVEEVEVPTAPKDDPVPKFLKLQPSTEGFRLVDMDTARYWGPPFKTPLEGIIWASQKGSTIK